MKFLWSIALALTAASTILAAGAGKHEEAVFIFQNRKVLIAVPEGFGFNSSRNDQGLMVVRVADPRNQAMAEITFSPDPDGQFASSALHRREFMHELFNTYVDGSVEKAMEFQELEPRSGAGTYCLLTDARLVGRSKVPPGEYVRITVGVKAWPGVVAIFTLAANDTSSKEYGALYAMLKQSVAERK